MHTPDRFATAFVAIVWAIWLAYLLGWIVKKSRVVSDTGERLRRHSPTVCALALAALLGLASFAVDKGTGNAPQGMGVRPLAALSVPATQPEAASPSLAVVSVWTNGVVLRAESTNAVEITAFRRIGGSEIGDWVECDAPCFRIGTNDFSRFYVSASGAVSFGTKRRPPVGEFLPSPVGRLTNAPPYQTLCPLRAHLGMVPEANWGRASRPGEPLRSRFWHDALPGGGRVLTWEDALVDRLPGRRVSFQVELYPSGDCVYRYDFHDCLDPPATNFVVGAQFGTNGVNALSILGTNTLAATVWNVAGAPVTNGVSIADLLCTNGVLRTPASFEIHWKNTTGLDPEADTDDDGLTDWEETFVWGTEANFADTDGDGRSDGNEIAWGDDPFDADEDGDGVPDGTSAADWAANTLWAANADGAANLVITLNETTIAPATFLIGDLAIPLANPASWSLRLVPGQMYRFRLHTQDNNPVDITLSPPPDEPMRTMVPRRDTPSSGDSAQSPLWQSPKNVLYGPTVNASGQMAIPTMEVLWVISHDGSHDAHSLGPCLHTDAPFTLFHPVVYPNGSGLGVDDILLQGAERIGGNIRLSVAAEPGSTASALVILPVDNFQWGYLECQLDAHRKDGGLGGSHCSICEMAGAHIDDVSLSVRSPLTLKHDNETDVTFHCEQAGHGSAVNPTILIRRTGTTDWYPLAQSFTFPWTARIAGFFELKGVATMDGVSVETSPVAVEVRYPCYDEVFSDEDVLSICSNLWNLTKELCTETQRQEVGCWIVLDTSLGKYERDDLKTGEITDETGNARVKLQRKPINDIVAVQPNASGYRYPVATVHTHTPTVYRSTGRVVGPSGRDISNARDLLAAPSAIIDYLSSIDPQYPSATNRIPAHFPVDSPIQLWKIDFPDRRPTPYVP